MPTRDVKDTLFGQVSTRVTIPRPAEVREYLVQYPDMIDLVLQVAVSASARFGPPTELSLELYTDPEIDDEYLTLYVRQTSYDEDILDQIEELSVRHERGLHGKSGWLLVTTDFCPPR